MRATFARFHSSTVFFVHHQLEHTQRHFTSAKPEVERVRCREEIGRPLVVAEAGDNGHNGIVFAIGGPFGHGAAVQERAGAKIKLSSMVRCVRETKGGGGGEGGGRGGGEDGGEGDREEDEAEERERGAGEADDEQGDGAYADEEGRCRCCCCRCRAPPVKLAVLW